VGVRRHRGRARSEAALAGAAVVSDAEAPVVAPIIDARGVGRVFGEQVAVEDLDLVVPPGSILGLIGPSGCGKTTTVRMLAGITDPTSGELRVFGHDPVHFSVRDRGRIGYMPQLPVLYPELTLWDNLQFCASLYGVKVRRRRQRLERLLELVDLQEHARKRLCEASGGMQRRLSLAATLVHDPDLLYLDEPTAGIDPILRERFWDHFRALRDEGRTLVVTTQYVGEAVHCDLVGVMTDARLVLLDTPEGLRRAAFGSEFVDLHVDGAVDRPLLGLLQGLADVAGAPVHRGDGIVRVPVVDAAGAIPELVAWAEARGVSLRGIEPHVPEYDEVFVAIVERARTATEPIAPLAAPDGPGQQGAPAQPRAVSPAGPPPGPTGPPPAPPAPSGPPPGPLVGGAAADTRAGNAS
jgi:ABC-2 type transport system ATP-binding protein